MVLAGLAFCQLHSVEYVWVTQVTFWHARCTRALCRALVMTDDSVSPSHRFSSPPCGAVKAKKG